MSAGLREFLYVVEESAYNTAVVSPTAWTTATTYGLANAQGYYVRLDGGNAFSMRSRPSGTVTVPYGGGFDVPAYMTADKQELRGRLSLILSVSQAPFFLSWAGVRITGGTSPWTTSEPNGDLASCTLYHAITQPGGTVERRSYSGAKVDAWTLSVSESSTIARLTLDISASTPAGTPAAFGGAADPTSTPFPTPADNNFAIDPFVFISAGGASYVTFGGSVRTQFTDLTISVQNTLARRWYAQRYISFLRLMGRHTTLATKFLYTTRAGDRYNYETLASETASIQLNNGTHGFTMNLNAQNVWTPFEDDLPLNDIYMMSATSGNLWDASAGSDFSLSFT
jgi:hypothetical protein